MAAHLNMKELVAAINDPRREGDLYEEMQRLRVRFTRELISNVQPSSPLERAQKALGPVFREILKQAPGGVSDADPGHGYGHWCRDYIHALYLAHDPELDAGQVFCGVLAGTLHDIGTLFVDRYQDRKRAIRHAEVGALIVRQAAIESGALTNDEADLVAYAVAARTHYLRDAEVVCADGQSRVIRPYITEDDIAPVLQLWLPRWADRLDCSGPCMVGRHFLTLARDHEDFSQAGFYNVTFAEHMRPLLRAKEQIAADGGKQTMLEHMRMFADSQTNDSVYGKHDRGPMIRIRDEYREALRRIIVATQSPVPVPFKEVMTAFTGFLGDNIEPTPLGKKTAGELRTNFEKLNPETQRAWASGFLTTMKEYVVWSIRLNLFLGKLPRTFRQIDGFVEDVGYLIATNGRWYEWLLDQDE